LKIAASLDLKPAEFWSLTLIEFDLYCEGRQLKQRGEIELVAWQCANFMNCFTKKKITVNKLLGKATREKTESKPGDLKKSLKERRRKREEREFWGK